ncbi:hyalin-like [Apostichopus japonicus]|uniref:hyalin-like n=1 Tax=Stichopus japonicus TaxID=307972 RepID=UPI003AB385CC
MGVTTVTCSCEDLSQNTDECSFTITVKDVTNPTASCPNDIDADATLQRGTTARVDFVTTCSDNIDTGIQAACNATSQSEFPMGVTTVTCSCEDLSQNTDECSFTITVKDVTNPTANCPNDIDADATLQRGTTARVDFVTSCSDNIDTGIQAACNTTSQSEFPMGVTTVTCSCEDLSQNTDECAFTITVKDVTNPTASCPNDIDADATLQRGTTARVDFVTTCSDNIDTGIQAACNATSQSEFPMGVTTVTCSCEDLSQNTDECSFTITVKDVTNPTANCPNDIDADEMLQRGTTARVDFVTSCSDNTDTGIQAACNATSQSEFPMGVTTVTCSCEDLSQNTDECSFTITVKDVTNPTANCPNDIDADARLQRGTTARVDFVTSCSDNIDTGIQAACNTTSRSEFPMGVTTVTCSCEDLSQNTDECSFTITVKDVTNPTANCPNDIDADATLQRGTTARVDFVTTCSDNIDTGIQAACNATSQSEFPMGVTTVTCSCEDLSQNTDECSFTITVKDVTNPTANCPNDIDADATLQRGTTARVDFVTSCSDNIDTGIQAACNATSQSEFPMGVTTVTCSCEDMSQNTDECSFTITVKDVTNPTASCPNDIRTDARLQRGTTARVDFEASCSDNIDTGIQAACDATSRSEFQMGITTVTCSCEDLSQNTDECSFTITVKDVTHPTASCPNDIDTDARLQNGTTARVDFVASCSENVDTGIQAACNATSQSEFSMGVTTVTCSCEDLSQNTDECSFTVTVKDVTHPTASCPNDIDTNASLQNGTTARVDFVASCSDNVDTGIQAACNATSQRKFPVGVTTVSCSCEDLSQNTDECSFTITVKDVTHPTASCPNDIDTNASLQNGTTARVNFEASCSDNVDTGIQAACNATSQRKFPVGVTTVTCSCEDLSQNTDECSFTVTVKDVTHPTASCPNDIDTNASLRNGTTARVNFVASCSENVDTGIQAACNATSQSEFPLGATTVTCSCEDLSQNTDECSFTVTVKGNFE